MTGENGKTLGTLNQFRALGLSTFAFVICFAVWTIFSIVGIKIRQDLNLTETEFALLIAMPILTGSLSRFFLGLLTDRFGGRLMYTLVMLLSALCTWFLASVTTYYLYLLIALGIGFAGGSFAVGIAYVARWFPPSRQGTAMGVLGIGSVGAAITNFLAPFLLVTFGQQGLVRIYAVVLFLVALMFWFFAKQDPVMAEREKTNQPPPKLAEQLSPLLRIQVWRFAVYYFFLFGGFVSLALWLPQYYMGAYKVNLEVAGMLAACYALPGSLFRALGGWFSDRFGARRIMYWTLSVAAICLGIMSFPPTHLMVEGMQKTWSFSIHVNLLLFVVLTIVLGFHMSVGKAAVYKHIAHYYPSHIGSVGGIVGLIGGLGGFVLPILFGIADDYLALWTVCFMILCVLAIAILLWMHLSVLDLKRIQALDSKAHRL